MSNAEQSSPSVAVPFQNRVTLGIPAADLDLSLNVVRTLAARMKDEIAEDLRSVSATDDDLATIKARLIAFQERHGTP